ncbi:MAG TPA: PaaX family transcriptional regulator C-terminal domain-containing protein [Nocardioidaceae bacterium]|nr:PaaX family transcriptional regulator C-terminal domain-containing protein [Nocardioidaceae bacterium]
METQPRSLITTLYGLYARAEQDWLSVASLVRLMADLGVEAAAVRSSVSRLKKRDVLRSLDREGRAGYVLSPSTAAILRDGDTRIWSRRRAEAQDGWLVVVFSVPEAERERRHTLRTQLRRLGFGTVAPGVWVAPGTTYDEAVRALDRHDLTAYTDFFDGTWLDPDGPGDALRERIGRWWDLGALERAHRAFVNEYAPQLRRGAVPPREAFTTYVPMLTAWRRLPYLDPGLPLGLLPEDWAGLSAERLFADLDERLRGHAEKHARALIHSPG